MGEIGAEMEQLKEICCIPTFLALLCHGERIMPVGEIRIPLSGFWGSLFGESWISQNRLYMSEVTLMHHDENSLAASCWLLGGSLVKGSNTPVNFLPG